MKTEAYFLVSKTELEAILRKINGNGSGTISIPIEVNNRVSLAVGGAKQAMMKGGFITGDDMRAVWRKELSELLAKEANTAPDRNRIAILTDRCLPLDDVTRAAEIEISLKWGISDLERMNVRKYLAGERTSAEYDELSSVAAQVVDEIENEVRNSATGANNIWKGAEYLG